MAGRKTWNACKGLELYSSVHELHADNDYKEKLLPLINCTKWCLRIGGLKLMVSGYCIGFVVEKSGFDHDQAPCVIFSSKTVYSDSCCFSPPRSINGDLRAVRETRDL